MNAISGSQRHKQSPPVVLSIAGTDSGGGAGIQADLKTMTVLGGFGVSVITALTAQNGAGVRGIHEVPVDFVLLQLKTVREGFPVKAAKTGMLASSPIIEALAEALADKEFPLVVDPVCISQSGHRLLREDAEDALRKYMLPLADLLTPNLPEAELLTGMRLGNEKNVAIIIERLHSLGAKAVLLKGGHFPEYEGRASMVDWLGLPGKTPVPLAHPRIETPNNHGTGCTLSAALAACLAKGMPLEDSVRNAQNFLTKALANSFSPGIGAGPPNVMEGVAGPSPHPTGEAPPPHQPRG